MKLLNRLNLFHKVVVANAFIIAIGAIGGTWLTRRLAQQSDARLVVFFVLLGVAASIVMNFLVVHLAFRPLFRLEQTMQAIQSGEVNARIPLGFDDPQLEGLARAFNSMLEAIEAARKGFSARVLEAQEEERKRIARELHDETSQALTTVVINLELLERLLPPDSGRIKERLAAVRDLVLMTLEETRRLIHDLRPTILDDLGLVPAIRWYAKSKLESEGIKVAYQMAEECCEEVSPEIRTALFRIAQEAMTNILRHARAKNVRIGLCREGKEVRLCLEDDGLGFDEGELARSDPRGRGMGLFGMKERASLLGGEVKIQSNPGCGARVLVRIPLAGGADSAGKDTCPAGG